MNRLVFAAIFLASVMAMAPPHPAFEEEYKRHRRRLLSAANYTMTSGGMGSHLHPILCDNIGVDGSCRESSSSLGRSASTTLEVLRGGRLRPLVLLTAFTDHMERALPSKEIIEELWNSDATSDRFPGGSIRQYLRQNSYGRLDVKASVINWMVTDNTEAHYSFDKSGLTQEFSGCIIPLLQYLDSIDYDFSQHDVNGDSVIDSLVIMHSGFAAEIGGTDCYSGKSFETRIWSHAIPQITQDWVSKTGFSFNQYMVASALDGQCNDGPAQIGVVTHELIHTWGIPDLYDTSGDWVGSGTGKYSIMSDPFGPDGSQMYPPNLDPWSRIQSSWLTPRDILDDGIYTIDASAESPLVYIIQHNFPVGEYLLIENRQNVGYDKSLPGNGLLIWHIDEAQDGQKKRGYPGQGDWPGNGNHYKVALLQADTKFDLETGQNKGDAEDFWVKGSELRPGRVEYSVSDASLYPNTNSYMDGTISATGVKIYDISESGRTMTFRVRGFGPPTPPTDSPSYLPTPRPTVVPTETPTRPPTIPPTPNPTALPTFSPTSSPTTAKPSAPPTNPPTSLPTILPTTKPSAAPTNPPTGIPTDQPTSKPSHAPTNPPTRTPTKNPTARPTQSPTKRPTLSPSQLPTSVFSDIPSPIPSSEPSVTRSANPTVLSSSRPSITSYPSILPTSMDSESPTRTHSAFPSSGPSLGATEQPTVVSSASPSLMPTVFVSTSPSVGPTIATTGDPSFVPSGSSGPSVSPNPTQKPSMTTSPTVPLTISPIPTMSPRPSNKPSISKSPTTSPTEFPSSHQNFGGANDEFQVLLEKYASSGAALRHEMSPRNRYPY